MDVVVIGRHTKISEEYRTLVAEKVRRIATIDRHVTGVEVHVVHNKTARAASERERVEVTVYSRGPVIRSEASAEDRHVALDLATDRVVERLRKRHERRASRATRHRGLVGVGEAGAVTPPLGLPVVPNHAVVSVEPWEGAPDTATREIPLDGTPIVIRSKTHEGHPMSVSEAIDQMELVGHDFFLFHDSESGLPSAVYRRRGWTYGVIHLTRSAAMSEDGEHQQRDSA